MAADLDLVRRLGSAEGGLAVVATPRGDGSVQASVVSAGVLGDPPRVGFVVRGNARKLVLFRRSGRACVVFRSGWEWVAVEGPVEIVGPDGPEVAQLIRDVFIAAGGTHDNWLEFDRVMAEEHRTVVLVEPARITSN